MKLMMVQMTWKAFYLMFISVKVFILKIKI